MIIDDLLEFDDITLQCHDFPDADSIASGFVLDEFLRSHGKKSKLIYSGKRQITKTNLCLMIEKLGIDIIYVSPEDIDTFDVGNVLVTVDCQYGSGNVTRIEAPIVMIIDHHRVENEVPKYSHIESDKGSCSTIIWNLIRSIDPEFFDERTGTALYYGLFTDTNMFSEIKTPLDMDLRDEIPFTNSLLRIFKNSNISLDELDIAGIAMQSYIINEEFRFAIIMSNPCDPNILGLIADFLLQVDSIDTCVVFAESGDGIKYSVRSCNSGIPANELSSFLAGSIGSGGGHVEKAGGYISMKLLNEQFPNKDSQQFFVSRMIEYHGSFDTITSGSENHDVTGMTMYKKKKMRLGFVPSTSIAPVGVPIAIRTLEGDTSVVSNSEVILMIGIKGEVYSMSREKFERSNIVLDEPYDYSKCVVNASYLPKARNTITGVNVDLINIANLCETTGENTIYARKLSRTMKVFTPWYKEGYMRGDVGDYLAIRTDDTSDCYIVDKEVFPFTYEEC